MKEYTKKQMIKQCEIYEIIISPKISLKSVHYLYAFL